MIQETYLSNLTAELHCRGVDEDRILEIVTEVENHLQDSDEQPEEAFGPATKYAETMAALSETDTYVTDDQQWVHRTFRATAFDEMGILESAGQEGWELVDVGAYALFCRRPKDQRQACRWEYKRRTGTHHIIFKQEMLAEKWEPCGNWIVLHYFKRKISG